MVKQKIKTDRDKRKTLPIREGIGAVEMELLQQAAAGQFQCIRATEGCRCRPVITASDS